MGLSPDRGSGLLTIAEQGRAIEENQGSENRAIVVQLNAALGTMKILHRVQGHDGFIASARIAEVEPSAFGQRVMLTIQAERGSWIDHDDEDANAEGWVHHGSGIHGSKPIAFRCSKREWHRVLRVLDGWRRSSTELDLITWPEGAGVMLLDHEHEVAVGGGPLSPLEGVHTERDRRRRGLWSRLVRRESR